MAEWRCALNGGSENDSGVELHYIGVLWGLYWDNGKENGNYYSIMGLYRGNLHLYSSRRLKGWDLGFKALGLRL